MAGASVEDRISRIEGNVPSILVELVPRPGVRQVSLSALSREDVAIESASSMRSAMNIIQSMAERFTATLDGVEEASRPTGAEIDFSIKLDTEGGAFLAKSGDEGAIGVRLVWSP